MRTLFLAASFFLAAHAASGAQRPDIIVIDICSARADHFGLYGYPKDTTPGLDALAQDTFVFDRAVSQSSWCLPNYASLFTGLSPEAHGQYTNDPARRVPESLPMLAEKMKEGGYATASFTGGIYFLKGWGLDRGFDKYVNWFSTTTSLPARFRDYIPEVLNWIQEKKKDREPLFLYVSVDDLHAPYQSDEPERYDAGYAGVVHDTSTLNVRSFRSYNMGAKNPAVLEFKKNPRHLRHLVAHYDAALRDVDAAVSSFTARLKDLGVWENAMVVITADHGEMLGENSLLGHTEGLYEGVLHVPLLIRYPELAGRRMPHLVQRLDLTPTLLEAAGVDSERLELEGTSLLPILKNPALAGRSFAYASSRRNIPDNSFPGIDERMIRDRRWKLHYYLHKNRYELYDLETDPLETNDLSFTRPDQIRRLSLELMRRMELIRPSVPGGPERLRWKSLHE